MRPRTSRWVVLAMFTLVILACTIEEDLRINADGSGTYRVRVTIPKELGELDELRREAEKSGFVVGEQSETEKERFIVLHKTFTDITTLNDANSSYSLEMKQIGLFHREYRLRATLGSVGFGNFRRRMVVTMPGSIQSSSAGQVSGSRLTWESSTGGTIEVVARGFYAPLSRNQKILFALVIAGGLFLLAAVRRRRRHGQPELCTACQTPILGDARFCRSCGAGAPVPERKGDANVSYEQ